MPPPQGFRILMESLEKIEDECSSADDKKNKELGALRGAEGTSADPFVQKKMQIQNKVNETKKHLAEKDELLKNGQRGHVSYVKQSATIRKSIKDLQQMKNELESLHKDEVDKAVKKARKKKGDDGVKIVEANATKRDEIIGVIDAEIENLTYAEKTADSNSGAGGAAGQRANLTRGAKKVSRPKPPAKNLEEMDGGCEGLDQAFLQIAKNDQELDQDLDLIHAGVKQLGIMAEEMGTELKTQGMMINETKLKADEVNERLTMVNVRMKDALDKSKDRGCMSMICIILILAIVGYIYKMVA